MRTYFNEYLIEQQKCLYNVSDFRRLKEKRLIKISDKITYLAAYFNTKDNASHNIYYHY